MQDVDRFARLFETFSPSDVDRLAQWYMPDASFRDPFSDVHGLAAIQAVYRHMFDGLDRPRFFVLERMQDRSQVILIWDFKFGLRGEERSIRGVSQLELAGDGRIAAHRDYWDSAELYECFPGLGVLMRWLRRKAQPRT